MLTDHHTYPNKNKNTLIEETGSICLLNHKRFLKDILKITRLNIVGREQSTGDI